MTPALVIPRSPAKQIHPALPPLWHLFVQRYLGAGPHLTKALWRAFARTARPDQVYLLRQAARQPGDEPLKAFLEAVTPGDMFRLTVALSPEGRRRDPHVVQFEEQMLRVTDRHGQWQ